MFKITVESSQPVKSINIEFGETQETKAEFYPVPTFETRGVESLKYETPPSSESYEDVLARRASTVSTTPVKPKETETAPEVVEDLTNRPALVDQSFAGSTF
ncbi:hypothetical protein EVB32_245 [Rhizobium phage RHph_TM39]|uniref:Uncharacterized protein n=1 Tax=Rhizobium phage RHph_Y65 TaxID=2509785 RepID=A0A7S5R811_9CAUD|nr:hypothetical protein PQC17_gp264 [Rhizobium phage RHph_Y65]QIG72459.1 hypothetical protein EVB96_263 [Rhizobium phage RHph_TM3_3_6]QIG72822.1 hypothetical protein EVB97_264 [Rhizobium phage RHph_Y65]QIG77233.1 hypothetical protein EVB32_245 [Rhizobium phage RHph_TM39]QIG77848.1 hypothetical protein EVB64_262 [Rhizobium phage RHph_TM61]